MEKSSFSRRQFVSKIIAAAGVYALAALPRQSKAAVNNEKDVTVQDVIDMFIHTVPSAPIKGTVDTIKAGNASQKVNGIVTTMFPTIDVIRKTIALGANFIIAHEPTFYNHTDETKWLGNDAVYHYKLNLLNKHNIAVWRCHDYIHSHTPDGVLMGVLTALEWDKYYDAANPNVITIKETSFEDIISHTKNKLEVDHVRIIGQLSQPCKRILIMPGAAGGTRQISSIQKTQPDLIIVGEVNEWETSEYIRDMQLTGGKIALMVLGHIVSEEAGMQWMMNWLHQQLPQIKTTHVPSHDAFNWA